MASGTAPAPNSAPKADPVLPSPVWTGPAFGAFMAGTLLPGVKRIMASAVGVAPACGRPDVSNAVPAVPATRLTAPVAALLPAVWLRKLLSMALCNCGVAACVRVCLPVTGSVVQVFVP